MSWTCDGLKPQRRERWNDSERINRVVGSGRGWSGTGRGGREQNCSGPIAWAFLKTSRDAPINTVRTAARRGEGATRLSLYFSTYLLSYTTPGPDNRYNRTWNAHHRHHALVVLWRNSDSKTVSSTLADSLDRYFNPFLAPRDPARSPARQPARLLSRARLHR